MRERLKNRTLAWIQKMEMKHGKAWRKKFITQGRLGIGKRGPLQPKLTLETKNKRGTCPDQLLAKIQEVATKLGRTPSKDEFISETGTQRYVHLIYSTFGSWLEAIKKLNLTPKVNLGGKGNPKKHYTDDELLRYLSDFHKNTGKIPTETDCRRKLVPPSTLYARRFGSLPLARERAGVYAVPSRWTT